jgi:Domain of unknown function (DUF3402)
MPHLQSVVIVLLKVILTNVGAMVHQSNGQNGHGLGYPSSSIFVSWSSFHTNFTNYSALNGCHAGQNSLSADLNCDAAIEELDNIRLREITGKAVSGSLLLLLKWFKRSRKKPCLSSQSTKLIGGRRRTEVRVYDPTLTRFKLSTPYSEDVRAPGCRSSDCSEE